MNFQNAERVVLKWLQENPRFSLLLSDERENRFYFEVPEITRQFHITLPSSRYGSLQIDSEDELSRKFLRTAKKLCTKRYDLSLQELLNSLLSSDMFYQKMYPSQEISEEDDDSDEDEENDYDDAEGQLQNEDDLGNEEEDAEQSKDVLPGFVAALEDDEANVGQNEAVIHLIEEGLEEEADAGHANLTLSETTLEDIPNEILQRILVESIVLELKDTCLDKDIWKENCNLVMRRLSTVSSCWRSIIATDFFRNKLHKTLDMTGQTIQLQKLQEMDVNVSPIGVDFNKDNFFILRHDENFVYRIDVYVRSDTTEVKDVITFPGMRVESIAVCSTSNCIYVLCRNVNYALSILRTTKDKDDQYVTNSWVTDLPVSKLRISASTDGKLLIISWFDIGNHVSVAVYDIDGSLEYQMVFSPDAHDFKYIDDVLRRSNGNFILVSVDVDYQRQLIEIGRNGLIIRKYRSSLGVNSCCNFADEFGAVVLSGPDNRMELLDGAFHPLQFEGCQMIDKPYAKSSIMRCHASEVGRLYEVLGSKVFVIFGFTGNPIRTEDEANDDEDDPPVGQD